MGTGKILIVDDEVDALDNCRRMLSRLGHECVTESDPVRAVQRIQYERPALILTDLRMPGLDGMGVLAEAKKVDPAIKVGTSTPKADPSGDYAFLLFEKADKLRPGAGATLASKALQLTGGPSSPPPPPDRSVYGAIVAGGQADVFLTYCTNAIVAQREVPSLVVSTIPPALAVGADYGIAAMSGAPDAAAKFVAFVLSPAGRRIIASHGFSLP